MSTALQRRIGKLEKAVAVRAEESKHLRPSDWTEEEIELMESSPELIAKAEQTIWHGRMAGLRKLSSEDLIAQQKQYAELLSNGDYDD